MVTPSAESLPEQTPPNQRWWSSRRIKWTAAVAGSLMAVTSGVVAYNHFFGTCLSPEAVSPEYPGDHALGVTPDMRTWALGILATTTNIPEGDPSYQGLVISFRNYTGDDPWHPSKPAVGIYGKKTALRIGDGPTQFRVQFLAENGSPICEQTPDTTFSAAQAIANLTGTGVIHPSW